MYNKMGITKSNLDNSRFIHGRVRAKYIYFLLILQGHVKVKFFSVI